LSLVAGDQSLIAARIILDAEIAPY
jgi:hypothetical protein